MSQNQENGAEAVDGQLTPNPTPGPIVVHPANPPLCDVCDELGDTMNNEEDQHMFRTYSDPGRKKSLKSLEIPLDNLLSGIIFLSGGRDKHGCPLVTITQPRNLEIEWLMELKVSNIIDMLAYFTSVPNEESRALGFVVLLDAEIIHNLFMKTLVKALSIIQAEDEPFKEVFFISSFRDVAIIDWKTEYEENIELPFRQISNKLDLLEFIDRDQLTPDFAGDLSYNHQEWVRFRMQVEPFLCDCISISKRLARAIEPFTDEEVPESIEDVKQRIQKHNMVRRKTLDKLHIDELTSEGSRINNQMVEGLGRKMSINPDVKHTVATIQKMLSQIELVKGRMVSLWSTKNEKLQANLKQRIFEKEATQLIEWFEEYAEEFFQTHTELGESLDVAETLVAELKQFEDSTKQIMCRVDDIVVSGSELEQNPHTDQETVTELMGKIQTFMTDFDTKLGKRKDKLSDSVRLHKLIEKAFTWSIEGALVLSETTGLPPTQAKELVQQFLTTHPRPTPENLKELSELSEESESHWIRDTSVFACNRVTDIGDRVDYTCKLIDDMVIKEKERRKSQEMLLDKTNGSSGSSPEMRVSSDALLVHQESNVSAGSLHYDTGADQALLLLQSVGDAVETAAERLDAGSLPSLPSSPVSTEAVDGGGQGDGQISLLDMLEELDKNEYPTLKRVSKRDISGPTAPSGPTFVPEEEEVCMLGTEKLTPEMMRRRAETLPCPDDSDFSAQTKNAKHRRKLMEELIETESAYIRDLEWVVNEYMPAMDDIENLPRSLVGKRNLIFCNIETLLEFNRQVILPSLESCRKCPIKLGQIFLMFEEDLLNYSLYFKNMPQQTRLMDEGGHTFFATVSNRLRDNFKLGSYLIKPFQRMARYQLFLKDLIKHSIKTDLAGKLKEYYDKLKEAQKMADFILRHGNDLLAVECLQGFNENMEDQGKILRQGDLVLVEITKHKRRVFLFERSIILAKRKKPKHTKDIAGSELFEYKDHYKTTDFVLKENVDGHPTRFVLSGKKLSLCFQADSVDLKNTWVQDIWDLFFSHMLQLKDKNLERHGSRALTSLMGTGLNRSATIGRSFGHSVRHTMANRSMRHRPTLDFPRSRPSRPGSLVSLVSNASEVSFSSVYSDDTASTVSNRMPPGSPRLPPSSPSTFMDLSASQVGLYRTSSGSTISDNMIVEQNNAFKRTSSGSAITMRTRKSPAPDNRPTSLLAVETHRTPEPLSPLPPTSSSSGASQDSDCEIQGPIFESPV